MRHIGDGRYQIESQTDVRPMVSAMVTRAGGQLLSLALREPSLEEIYARYFERLHRAA